MQHTIVYILLSTIIILSCALGISSCSDEGTNPADQDIILPDSDLTYFDDIRPLFIAKCASQSGCHSFSDQVNGLDLTDYLVTINHIVEDTDIGSEPLVISGNGAASFLYRILMDNEGGRPRMPLSGPPYLNRNNTDGVKIWIDENLTVFRN
jgi:hypothetical protein